MNAPDIRNIEVARCIFSVGDLADKFEEMTERFPDIEELQDILDKLPNYTKRLEDVMCEAGWDVITSCISDYLAERRNK